MLRYNSIVFSCYKNYKDKSEIHDMSHINNPEFYFRAGFLSFSFSLVCCSFWPREMEIILPVRLLPNVGGQRGEKAFQSTCIGCTFNRNINRYTSRPMRRFH